MPSPPTSLPSPDRIYDKYVDKHMDTPSVTPLVTPSHNINYRLRQSPTHTAKYIESTNQMGRRRNTDCTPIKRRSPSKGENETKKVKIRITLSDNETIKRGRGRPKVRPIHPPLPALTEEEKEFFKTFGNKLTAEEADTQRGTPAEIDKLRYEKAKQRSEQIQSHITPGTEIPRIKQIVFGDYLIDTWYVAPYPEEYSQNSTLFMCEFCMKYMKSSYVAGRHKLKCTVRYPPGDEIYRDDKISIFEVDGRKNKMYCQNLCLMAKMFLDHKTLYYDVEPFLFYIMTESDEKGCHFVGYFSKEKRSAMNYNVSCILTMPVYQRKGYGQFLIDFSYLLSKKENKTGSPERPLSDLGLLSYRSYWKNVIFRELSQQSDPISIEELSHRSSLTPDDIISTLETNGMLFYDKATKKYSIAVDMDTIRHHLNEINKKNHIKLNPDKLTWTPFILSRDRLAVLLGQTKHTIKHTDETADVDVEQL
ncbi:acyl-CoA N-acyltransferase [Pilobolus umbonatus]|nr:acyl-CoA N-acyltransferase [Pilobolus umbonatus]